MNTLKPMCPGMKRRNFMKLSGVLGSGVATWTLLRAGAAFAENPILHGFADPAMRVWNGRMYLAVGNDQSPGIKGFAMPYWAIYSSSDLVHWKQEKVIDPSEVSFMGKGSNRCWASDIAFRNDKFYFYFSDGGRSTGVLVADKPNGTYNDVLRKPLVAPANTHENLYDPELPPFSHPFITGVFQVWFCFEILFSSPSSRLCEWGKRSLLSTFA